MPHKTLLTLFRSSVFSWIFAIVALLIQGCDDESVEKPEDDAEGPVAFEAYTLNYDNEARAIDAAQPIPIGPNIDDARVVYFKYGRGGGDARIRVNWQLSDENNTPVTEDAGIKTADNPATGVYTVDVSEYEEDRDITLVVTGVYEETTFTARLAVARKSAFDFIAIVNGNAIPENQGVTLLDTEAGNFRSVRFAYVKDRSEALKDVQWSVSIESPDTLSALPAGTVITADATSGAYTLTLSDAYVSGTPIALRINASLFGRQYSRSMAIAPYLPAESAALALKDGKTATATAGGRTLSLLEIFDVIPSPKGATTFSPLWYTDADASTAALSEDGTLTPTEAGTIKVWVADIDGMITSPSVDFVIEPGPALVTALQLSRKAGRENTTAIAQVIRVDLNTVFDVTVSPDNALDTTFSWSTSADASIATLSPDGTLTPLRAGTIQVTVTANDGSDVMSATMPFTIEAIPLAVTALQLSRKAGQEKTTATAGGSDLDLNAVFDVTVSPDIVLLATVSWSTSADASIATLSPDGMLTPKGAGTIQVTVTANDGSDVMSATMPFTIEAAATAPVAALQLSRKAGQENTTATAGGSDLDLNAVFDVTVSPDNATDKTVSWSTSADASVATLSADGTLTPTGAGTIQVTVTANDGSAVMSAAVDFTIEAAATVPVAALQLSRKAGQENTAATAGGSDLDLNTVFDVTVSPDNATDKTVSWSTSADASVATLSADGTLTPTGAGTIQVTVTANDGSAVMSSPASFEIVSP